MIHEVRMPVLSQSMIQGRVVEWLKKEGEKVDKGSLLVVVESDKATHELEAPEAGMLDKILVQEGSEVDVNTILATITDGSEATTEPSRISPSRVVPASREATVSTPNSGERKPVSPVARRLAKELGIDIMQIQGTGLNGLITEKDVRLYADQHVSVPLMASEDAQVIPLTGQRGRIAERMALSRHTAADVTTIMDVDMESIVALHSKTKFSYTAYVASAASRALREFPLLNAWLTDERIFVKSAIHMGIAVAIDTGLVVPVIRNIDRMSISQIDQEINNLSTIARAGQLTPDDMKGSTFTLTNSGVFGSLLFTPIINLPEVAVLGMGKVADMPLVKQVKVVAGKVMYLCLSYDHRAVDGSTAVQFLHAVKNHLEIPE